MCCSNVGAKFKSQYLYLSHIMPNLGEGFPLSTSLKVMVVHKLDKMDLDKVSAHLCFSKNNLMWPSKFKVDGLHLNLLKTKTQIFRE